MLLLAHPNTNAHHGKPKDWGDERDGVCQTLPTVSVPGLHASFWQPTPEELDTLLRGGSIELRIASQYHPVVSVGVEEWPRQRHDDDGHPITSPHDTGVECPQRVIDAIDRILDDNISQSMERAGVRDMIVKAIYGKGYEITPR